MSIESNTGFAAGSAMKAGGDRDHDHAHNHSQAHDSDAAAKTFSPFLASVLDRLGLAVVFAGLVWIGVFWAVR
ncbi:hypothetical protein LB518_09340 [Mesorhizobium sp. BR1-1-16]|uniref:hypothetical protein n=1 Tax=Mesorhizobium sp. BR1-1-16 TaxID=2876653 RepID=UPI001CCB6D4F|nr:hypothetical protein [Mesorhizobium sp. BR1-1-16]MBZ9936497.1 hypothetical protein [Mesorhizobium sp. BR1-1-16]